MMSIKMTKNDIYTLKRIDIIVNLCYNVSVAITLPDHVMKEAYNEA